MSNLKAAGFWLDLSRKFTELGKKYPGLRRVVKIDGTWTFIDAPQEAIEEYKNVSEPAARACGFVGTRDQCCQYWLNRVNVFERMGK